LRSRPDGSATRYSHLSERLVSEGDFVGLGDVIGLSGCTGAHCKSDSLFLEFAPSGQIFNTKNRIDPEPCMEADDRTWSITCRDGGRVDDAFRLCLNDMVIGETITGEKNTIGINNIKPGSYKLTLKVIESKDGDGTFKIGLNNGVTFSDGKETVSGTARLNTRESWTIIVPTT